MGIIRAAGSKHAPARDFHLPGRRPQIPGDPIGSEDIKISDCTGVAGVILLLRPPQTRMRPSVPHRRASITRNVLQVIHGVVRYKNTWPTHREVLPAPVRLLVVPERWDASHSPRYVAASTAEPQLYANSSPGRCASSRASHTSSGTT